MFTKYNCIEVVLITVMVIGLMFVAFGALYGN